MGVGLRPLVELAEQSEEAFRLVAMREVTGVRKHLEPTSRHGSVRLVPMSDGNHGIARAPDQQGRHAPSEVAAIEHRNRLPLPIDRGSKRANERQAR